MQLRLFGGQAIAEVGDLDDAQADLAAGGDVAGCIGDDDREAHGPAFDGGCAGLGHK
jgi:hypothetical protein